MVVPQYHPTLVIVNGYQSMGQRMVWGSHILGNLHTVVPVGPRLLHELRVTVGTGGCYGAHHVRSISPNW